MKEHRQQQEKKIREDDRYRYRKAKNLKSVLCQILMKNFVLQIAAAKVSRNFEEQKIIRQN